MVKIQFENNVTKANAETFNTMQNNIENAINSIEIELDDTPSTSSTNGIENQAITNYVDNKILDTYSTSNINTYSCDYINNNSGGISSWTLLGSQSSSTPISLPSDYNEIMIIVASSDTARNWNVGVFSKSFINSLSNNLAFRSGHYSSSSDNSACAVWVKPTEIELASAQVNGSNVSATIYVYYR